MANANSTASINEQHTNQLHEANLMLDRALAVTDLLFTASVHHQIDTFCYETLGNSLSAISALINEASKLIDDVDCNYLKEVAHHA